MGVVRAPSGGAEGGLTKNVFVKISVPVTETGYVPIVISPIVLDNNPYIIELVYADGPGDTLFLFNMEGTLNLTFKRGERNEIGLVFPETKHLEYVMFFPKPGTYIFDVYARKEYTRHYIGSYKIKITGYPAVYKKIDPFDKNITDYNKYKIKAVASIKYNNETYLFVNIDDVKAGKRYSYIYSTSELIKPSRGDYVILSPLALQILLQGKSMTGKYLHLWITSSFEFNAYTEFFKNLFSGHATDRDTWFKQRIGEEVVNGLKKYGIVANAIVEDIKFDYDVTGILLGYNPNVKVTARIHLIIDVPAIPWWLIGIIIAGAIVAIIGYEIMVTITSQETTNQAYYRAISDIAKAWEKYYEEHENYIESYKKYLEEYEKWRKSGGKGAPPQPPKEPEPPEMPEPESPEELRKKSGEAGFMQGITQNIQTFIYAIIAIMILMLGIEAFKTFRGR